MNHRKPRFNLEASNRKRGGIWTQTEMALVISINRVPQLRTPPPPKWWWAPSAGEESLEMRSYGSPPCSSWALVRTQSETNKKKPSFSDFQNCQNEGICFNSALEISTKIDLGKSNL